MNHVTTKGNSVDVSDTCKVDHVVVNTASSKIKAVAWRMMHLPQLPRLNHCSALLARRSSRRLTTFRTSGKRLVLTLVISSSGQLPMPELQFQHDGTQHSKGPNNKKHLRRKKTLPRRPLHSLLGKDVPLKLSRGQCLCAILFFEELRVSVRDLDGHVFEDGVSER
jgi:hypothetical protein